jgi:hypothetical protein
MRLSRRSLARAFLALGIRRLLEDWFVELFILGIPGVVSGRVVRFATPTSVMCAWAGVNSELLEKSATAGKKLIRKPSQVGIYQLL